MPGGNFDAFIRAIALKRDQVPSFREYPFNIPVVRHLEELALDPRVTFFVGENGTGKSTLLEAVAVALGFNPEGGTMNFRFSTRDTHAPLHEFLRLVRGVRRPKGGFFLRAESLYNAATYMDTEVPECLDSYGGVSLHQQSHGESFMAILMHRFGPNGLYILDEPEAALSPLRQLALLSRLHELVTQNCQFIIATHSPIVMAYPQAAIYLLTQEGIHRTEYKETEHYRVARDFLNRTDSMLSELLKGQMDFPKES